MLTALFNFGKAIVRKGIQWFNKQLQQLTKPTDGSAVLEAVSDLMRVPSKQAPAWAIPTESNQRQVAEHGRSG